MFLLVLSDCFNTKYPHIYKISGNIQKYSYLLCHEYIILYHFISTNRVRANNTNFICYRSFETSRYGYSQIPSGYLTNMDHGSNIIECHDAGLMCCHLLNAGCTCPARWNKDYNFTVY